MMEIARIHTLIDKLPDSNPKSAHGVQKVPLHLVPPSALIYMARAFGNGAVKYGAYNWRETTLSASVYYAAAMRHMLAWFDGEELATDSGLPHMAHALACLALIVEATEGGNLVDDRPVNGVASQMLEHKY